jgi:hypothetical protein
VTHAPQFRLVAFPPDLAESNSASLPALGAEDAEYNSALSRVTQHSTHCVTWHVTSGTTQADLSPGGAALTALEWAGKAWPLILIGLGAYLLVRRRAVQREGTRRPPMQDSAVTTTGHK